MFNLDILKAARALIAALPRCGVCGAPATHHAPYYNRRTERCDAHSSSDLSVRYPWAYALQGLKSAIETPP